MIRTLPALFLLITVAACSSDEGSDTEEPTATASATTSGPATVPACSDVWNDGETLPADYAGCTPAEGATAGNIATCDNGADKYATYVIKNADNIETPYFALLGGPIFEYTDDEFGPYATAFRDCDAG